MHGDSRDSGAGCSECYNTRPACVREVQNETRHLRKDARMNSVECVDMNMGLLSRCLAAAARLLAIPVVAPRRTTAAAVGAAGRPAAPEGLRRILHGLHGRRRI